jgi:hypothetical protein
MHMREKPRPHERHGGQTYTRASSEPGIGRTNMRVSACASNQPSRPSNNRHAPSDREGLSTAAAAHLFEVRHTFCARMQQRVHDQLHALRMVAELAVDPRRHLLRGELPTRDPNGHTNPLIRGGRACQANRAAGRHGPYLVTQLADEMGGKTRHRVRGQVTLPRLVPAERACHARAASSHQARSRVAVGALAIDPGGARPRAWVAATAQRLVVGRGPHAQGKRGASCARARCAQSVAVDRPPPPLHCRSSRRPALPQVARRPTNARTERARS